MLSASLGRGVQEISLSNQFLGKVSVTGFSRGTLDVQRLLAHNGRRWCYREGDIDITDAILPLDQ